MTRLVVILFALSYTTASAQMYINENRQWVKRELEKQASKNDSITVRISETDTSILYSFRDPKVRPADFLYIFDESAKCIEEKTIGYCDSCFNKFLGSALNRKQFQWTKINDRLYISKYSKKLMLEIPVNNKDHSFTIRRMKWTKGSYRTLLKMK